GAGVAFFGTRWGALVAAAASSARHGAPLALLEPALDPERYFREAIRARLIHELKRGVEDGPSGEQLLAERRETGRLDVLGYPLDRALLDSAHGRGLVDLLSDRPRPVLIVGGAKGVLRPGQRELCERLTAAGFTVTEHALRDEAVSWFTRRVLRTI